MKNYKRPQSKKARNVKAQIVQKNWNAYKEINNIQVLPLCILKHAELGDNAVKRDVVQDVEAEKLSDREHLAQQIFMKTIPVGATMFEKIELVHYNKMRH